MTSRIPLYPKRIGLFVLNWEVQSRFFSKALLMARILTVSNVRAPNVFPFMVLSVVDEA